MASPTEYLTVYNSHTGQLLKLPKPLRLHTLGEFKNYLLEHFTNYIVGSPDNIFLLTAFGIKLNFSAVQSISEVYMFDKRLFIQGISEQIYQKYLQLAETQPLDALRPKQYEAGGSDARVSSKLKVIEGWTRALVQNSHQINERMDQYIKQTNAIFVALNIIFEFTTNYIRDIRKYHENHQNHVQLLSMKSLQKLWRGHLGRLREFPEFQVRADPRNSIKLADFLDESELAASAAFVGRFLPEVLEKFGKFSKEVSKVNVEQLQIDKTIESLRNDSISQFKDFELSKSAYVAEIEKLSSEILNEKSSDDVYGTQMERSSSLYAAVDARFQVLQSTFEFKCKLGRDCILLFEKMGLLQKTMVDVRNEIKLLTGDRVDDFPSFKYSNGDEKLDGQTISRIQIAEDHLSMPIDLPLLFGLMLIERRRQYEWYNFFLKGVVHNSSEQLTMIIKHEKDFQKLWVRKYSKLVRFLDRSNLFRIQLPAVDISVVNGQSEPREDSILAVVGDTEIDRQDISRYIQMIKNQKLENGTAETLTKNFDSLTVSTDNLKHITKIVATLSSFASPNHSKLKMQDENGKATEQSFSVENDADLNVINGLRSRIRCLENLLHQRQYQELLSWPVLKNSGGKSPDNRQSMLLLAPSQTNVTRSVSDSHRPALLRRAASIKSQSSDPPKVLDASVTIDKHLDNIRLRRENSELNLANVLLAKENESLKLQLETLRREMSVKDQEHQAARVDYEEKLAVTQTTIEELGKRHEEELLKLERIKNEEIADTTDENGVLAAEISSLKTEIYDLKKLLKDAEGNLHHDDELEQEISNLSAELSELKIANVNLSKTVCDLELNSESERLQHEKKIEALNAEVSDLNAEVSDLKAQIEKSKEEKQAAATNKTEVEDLATLLHLLNSIIVELFKHIGELVSRNLEFFTEFCFVLEFMGLLLVEDSETNELKITRVKGLKAKKGTESLDEKILEGVSTPHTEIHPKTKELAIWTKKLVGITSLDSDDVNNFKQLSELFSLFFQGENTAYTRFFKYISFTENVQLQTHYSDAEVINEKFFLNGISKRFMDVEGFAKKLTKENKQKALELAKCVEMCKSKITLSNFSPGDLVLFLPLKIDNQDFTPWTAFNIDSPHYLLDPESNQVNASKEWIVNRVDLISEHRVTEEHQKDKLLNPFALEVSQSWYTIYTA